ncbi:hypothetical protein Tco_0738037, partial [Tanacetum coccineum]
AVSHIVIESLPLDDDIHVLRREVLMVLERYDSDCGFDGCPVILLEGFLKMSSGHGMSCVEKE